MSVFKKPGGRTFFKAGDHMNDVALLFEPKSVKKDVENTFNGVTKYEDQVTTDITIFRDVEELAKGKPSEIIKDAIVANAWLASALEQAIGDPVAATITKKPNKHGGSGYAFRWLSPEDEAKVQNYYLTREQELVDARAAAPSFD